MDHRLHKTNESWGVAFAAFVRKDHVPVSGYGKIATFYFIYNRNSPLNGIPLKFDAPELKRKTATYSNV